MTNGMKASFWPFGSAIWKTAIIRLRRMRFFRRNMANALLSLLAPAVMSIRAFFRRGLTTALDAICPNA